jgi:small conductance mechanosensitive channel
MITLDDIQNWLKNTGGSAAKFLFHVLLAIVIYLVVRKIVKKFCAWLSVRMDRMHVEQSAKSFILSLLRYGTLGFTIITIVVQLEIVEASAIAALIASAGVGISLALKGGLSNFAGGIILLLLKPFRVGDYIVVPSASVEGTVNKMELYYTSITTVDSKVVMIPNATLTDTTIVNLTALDKRKMEVKIGISYQADTQRARESLQRILNEDPRIEKEDRQIFVDSLGESAVTLGCRAWVATDQYWDSYWKLNERIKKEFDDQGIEIPYNQLDVHIR